jgi:HEAT repeat protein
MQDVEGNIRIRYTTIEDKEIQGVLTDPQIQEALLYALLHEPRDNVRLKSIGLLASAIQQDTVVKALQYALEKDQNPAIRLKAIRLLITLPIDDQLKKLLIYALFQDSNAGVRIEAAKALKSLEDPSVLAILQGRAKADPYTRALLAERSNDRKSVSLSRE